MSLNSEDREVCGRIKILFEKSEMTQLEFSNRIGMTQASLSNVMLQKTTPGSKFIQGILREFQNVNSRWLHLGEEPIFSTHDQQLKSVPIIKEQKTPHRAEITCSNCEQLKKELTLKYSEIDRLQKKIIDLYELNPGILIPIADKEADTG